MHVRSILIVTIPLPLAVLIAFLGMHYAGVSSNIMSLAGIAIAIGVLVDAGIVVTENAFRFVEQRQVDPRDRHRVWEAVRDSTRLVGRPVFFSMTIILLAFVPVFALTGQEGKLFHPLAFTKTFAVLAATVIAITLVPVLCTLLLGGRVHAEEANPVMRLLRRGYQPALEAALSHRTATVSAAVILFAGSLLLARGIGSEFMPTLDEGDLMFMPIADPSISLEENTRIAARQNAALMTFPEVAYAVAKVARADTSTDPAPLNMTETIVHLKPKHQWRPGMTLDRLRGEMSRAVQIPGVANIWTMPIINRIDMLTTGIRSEVGVKVLGTDLDVVEALARNVAETLRRVPGATNVYPEQVTNGQYLNITIDRAAAARYGIGVGEVQQVVETAIGETTLTTTIEGRRRFPVRVRYAPEYRADPQALGGVLVASPSGVQVPLGQLARIEQSRGPAMISSENGLLLATVLLNVQGRDVGGFVEEARAAVARDVTLPPGYYIGWSGRWENQERARQRLQIVLPVVLLVIFVLLYFTYHSVVEAAHVLLAVPFALTGGVYLLWLLGYNFSVAVWVGFIALFGTAVQTGVVMVIYLEEAVERKRQALGGTLTRAALREAVIEGALLRLRPKVMTVSTVIAGLLPIMWSTRAGAEVMKPLATPVLGGMASSLIHVLIVTPVIFFSLRERRLGIQHQPLPALRSPAPRQRVLRCRGCCAADTGRRCRLATDPTPAARRRCTRPVAHRPDRPLGCHRHRPAVANRHPAAGSQHVRHRVQAGRRFETYRRGQRPRQRRHVDARHGDVRRAPGAADRRGRTLHRDCGIRDGRRVAVLAAVVGRCRTGIGELRGERAMSGRWTMTSCVGTLLLAASVSAQVTETGASVAARFVDTVNGLSLDQAIARALEHEPSLQATRSGIDVAKGRRQQAGLRPNPSVTFERREEPSGTDNQTMVAVEWPLDLFRRSGRIAVAEHEITATEHSVADRERMLAADVRSRFGEVLAAIRELALLDDLVSATRRQHELLRSRVAEGATPPLDRDLLEIELRRLEADRLLQLGRTEAATFGLKRMLGYEPDASLTVRDTLQDIVLLESVPAIHHSIEHGAQGRRAGSRSTNRRGRREDRPRAARRPFRRQRLRELRAHGRRVSADRTLGRRRSRARPRHFSLCCGRRQADAAGAQSKPGRCRRGTSRARRCGGRVRGGTPGRPKRDRRRGRPRRARARRRQAVCERCGGAGSAEPECRGTELRAGPGDCVRRARPSSGDFSTSSARTRRRCARPTRRAPICVWRRERFDDRRITGECTRRSGCARRYDARAGRSGGTYLALRGGATVTGDLRIATPPVPINLPPNATVTLSPEAVARAGIVVAPVTYATIRTAIRLPGVVEPNAYKQAAVTPLVAGRVTHVSASAWRSRAARRDDGSDLQPRARGGPDAVHRRSCHAAGARPRAAAHAEAGGNRSGKPPGT